MTANNKEYDENTTATLSGAPLLVGVEAGDVVTVGGTPTANFVQSSDGDNISVTVTGYTLSGSSSSNYALTQPSGLTASIFSRTLATQTSKGVAVGPTLLATNSSPVAVLGFSLAHAGIAKDFTKLVLPTSSDPRNVFSSVGLVRSLDDSFSNDDSEIATGTLGLNTITFENFTPVQALASTAGNYHYFVQATVNPSLPSASPTITITLTPSAALSFSNSNTADGLVFRSIDYAIVDNIAPTLTSIDPAQNTLNVALGKNLVITLSEEIKLGMAGTISIVRLAGTTTTTIESFDVLTATTSQLSIVGNKATINPTNNFAAGAEYYIVISDGAITDRSGNFYSGTTALSSPTVVTADWSFTTYAAPEITTSTFPTKGCIGDQITIKGKYFTGVNQITFSGLAASVTTGFRFVSDTEIMVTVPLTGASGTVRLEKTLNVVGFGTTLPNEEPTTSVEFSNFPVGPQSARLTLGSTATTTVCSATANTMAQLKVDVIQPGTDQSSTGTKYTVVYNDGYQLTTINDYVSGTDFNVTPSPAGYNATADGIVSNFQYLLVSITAETPAPSAGCAVPSTGIAGFSVLIAVKKIAVVDAGGDQNFCLLDTPPFRLMGGTVRGSVTTGSWKVSAPGTNSVVNPTNLATATYNPSLSDANLGAMTFNLTAANNPPCPSVASTKTVTFTSASFVSAGEDQSICFGATSVKLEGKANVPGTWSLISPAEVAGNFSDSASPISTYTFNAVLPAGTLLIFQYSPTGSGGCGGPGTADRVNVVVDQPIVLTGDRNPEVCEGTKFATYTLNDTHVGSTFLWRLPTVAGFPNKPQINTPNLGANSNYLDLDWTDVPPGTYSLTGVETRTNKCEGEFTFNITVNPLPTVEISSPATDARIFSRSDQPKIVIGNAKVNGVDISGIATFDGSGISKTPTSNCQGCFDWYFSPSLALGSRTTQAEFSIKYSFKINDTQCANSLTVPFTVLPANAALNLQPTGTIARSGHLPNNFCSDLKAVSIALTPTYKDQLIRFIRGDLKDYVLVDDSGNVISKVLKTDGLTITHKVSLASSILPGAEITTFLTPLPPTANGTEYRSGSYALFYPRSLTIASPTKVRIAARYEKSDPLSPGRATTFTLTIQDITINPLPELKPKPSVLEINGRRLCTNAGEIELGSGSDSDVHSYSYSFVDSNPDDNFILKRPTATSQVYILAPQNALGLWSGTDYNPKDREMIYSYQDNKGCDDMTRFRVQFNRRPPAPTIDPGAEICVINGETPLTASITDALASTDPDPAIGLSANTFSWFGQYDKGTNALTKLKSSNSSFNPGHTVESTNYYAVQSINNCQSEVTTVRYIVLTAPIFKWDKFYIDGSPINFSVDLQNGLASRLEKIDWTINNRAGAEVFQTSVNDLSEKVSTPFRFAEPDIYTVNMKLTATPAEGNCVASISDTATIVPSAAATPTSAFVEMFETNSGGWVATGKNPSWAYGVPSGTKAKLGTSKIWATNLTDSYNNSEFSYLYTPLIDITSLERPMISFETWVDTDIDNRGLKSSSGDGAVLQYSTDEKVIGDPAKKWLNLGAIGQGEDWFNLAFLTANPAAINGINDGDNLNIGWAGTDPEQTDWNISRYVLDGPRSKGTKAVFRFVFASNDIKVKSDQKKGLGFALDNFRIGNRTRTILYENFSNKGSNGSVESFESRDLDFKFNLSRIGTQMVKINYHLGFPSADPFNLDNPADVSARALFYGISKTPVVRLDGSDGPNREVAPNQLFSKWGLTTYNTRTLVLAQASVNIKPVERTFTSNGKVAFNVEVSPIVDLPANTTLHTAILEQSIPRASLTSEQRGLIDKENTEAEFNYVLKKLLPTAEGTNTGAIAKGTTKTFGPFEWVPNTIALYPPNTANLSIVAFLQDVATKNIYQAEVKINLDDPTDLVTATEISQAEQMHVYPNPSDSEFTIELPVALKTDASVRLFDHLGRSYNMGNFAAGKNTKTVSTSGLSSGVFIVEINTDGKRVRKKVMVAH